jgi:hypothetical protein
MLADVVQYRWHNFTISGLKALAQSEAGPLREMPAERVSTPVSQKLRGLPQLKGAAGNPRALMTKTSQTS